MITGVFERNGKVVVDFDNGDLVEMSWREAGLRGRAIIAAEAEQPRGRRMPDFNKVIEGLIAAIRDARKKDDPTYTCTERVARMAQYRPGPDHLVNAGIDTDGSGRILIPVRRGPTGGLILPR